MTAVVETIAISATHRTNVVGKLLRTTGTALNGRLRLFEMVGTPAILTRI